MTVSQQIIEVIDNLAQKLGVAIDWSQQNIMPYLQELCGKYIKWEIGTSVMWICFGVLLIVGGFLCVKAGNKWHNTHKNDFMYEGLGKVALYICAVVVWLIALFMIMHQICDIVTCCTFPEMQIFNYINSLLSTTPQR